MPRPPAFTSHNKAGLPKKGATIESRPINNIALCGVLYFGCRSLKNFGNCPASDIAYIARLPPIKNAFQLVNNPPIPAKTIRFPIAFELNNILAASAAGNSD